MKTKLLTIACLLAVAATVPLAIGTTTAPAMAGTASTCQTACYTTFMAAQADCKAEYPNNIYYGQCMTIAGNTYGRCLSACSE